MTQTLGHTPFVVVTQCSHEYLNDELWPVCDYQPIGAVNGPKFCRSRPPAGREL